MKQIHFNNSFFEEKWTYDIGRIYFFYHVGHAKIWTVHLYSFSRYTKMSWHFNSHLVRRIPRAPLPQVPEFVKPSNLNSLFSAERFNFAARISVSRLVVCERSKDVSKATEPWQRRAIEIIGLLTVDICWWFRIPANSPVEVGNATLYLQFLFTFQVVITGFLSIKSIGTRPNKKISGKTGFGWVFVLFSK